MAPDGTANGCGNYGTPFLACCYYSSLISHSARSAVLPCLVVLAVPSVDNDARRAGPVPSAGSQHLARRRRWTRSLVILILTALGLAGIVGGAWLAYGEMTRTATRAEIAAAGQAELASRWERLTAGQMFPASVGYTGLEGVKTTASLVGVAPRASCRAALDPPAAAALDQQGCTAVLRAAYTDASGAFVLTAGVAVMRSAAAADRAMTSLTARQAHGGVKPALFGGTVADQPGGAGGAWSGGFHVGPYIILFTGGYADGQPAGVTTVNPALVDLAYGVVRPLASLMSPSGSPCARPDVQC
jgi:hypothetical protein